MAYVLANKDGTSNARPGDIVVTGGGLYQKNADGTSKKVGALPTDTGTTKSYDVVRNVYREIMSMFGGNSDSGSNPSTSGIGGGDISSGYREPQASVKDVDDNGIVGVQVSGYDPGDYHAPVSASAASSGVSKVAGYVVLGLCGIALLDRFMNKPKKG